MAGRRAERCPFCATPLGPEADRCPECGADPEAAARSEESSASFGPGLHEGAAGSSPPSGLELLHAPTPAERERPVRARRAGGGGDVYAEESAARGRTFRQYADATTPREGLPGLWRGLVTILGVLVVTAVVYVSYFGFSFPLGCLEPPPERIHLGQSARGELSAFRPTRTYELVVDQSQLVLFAVEGDFDNVVELYRETSELPMASDDDSGPGVNARLVQPLGRGTYYVVVRAFGDERGSYTLTVSSAR